MLILAATLAQFLLLALWVRAGSAVWRARERQHPQAVPAYITLGTALTLMPAPLLYLAAVDMLSLPRCYSVAPQALLLLIWPELLTVVLALCAAALAGRMAVGEAVRLLRTLSAGTVIVAAIEAAVQWNDVRRFPEAACSSAGAAAPSLPLADGWPALLAFGALGLAWWQFLKSHRTHQPFP